MRSLFAMPHWQLDELGDAARARAERFTWDDFVDRIDDHVEELAGAPARLLV
jgi:hypothetical protein